MIPAIFNNLFNKLKNFSEAISNVNAISNRTWVLKDFSGGYCTYRFQQNGELLVGLNGSGQSWSYRFVSPNSLVIKDPKGDITILNHGYMFQGLLILEKEGTSDRVIFYDEKIISDGNIEEYIRNELIKKLNLKPVFSNGELFYVSTILVGNKIYDSNFQSVNTKRIKFSNVTIEIDKNSIVSTYFVPVVLNTKHGKLIVKTIDGTINEGQLSYFENNEDIPHGRYLIEGNNRIKFLLIIVGRIKAIEEHKHSISIQKEIQELKNQLVNWYESIIKNYIYISIGILIIICALLVLRYSHMFSTFE